jgi:hypothetical protein
MGGPMPWSGPAFSDRTAAALEQLLLRARPVSEAYIRCSRISTRSRPTGARAGQAQRALVRSPLKEVQGLSGEHFRGLKLWDVCAVRQHHEPGIRQPGRELTPT